MTRRLLIVAGLGLALCVTCFAAAGLIAGPELVTHHWDWNHRLQHIVDVWVPPPPPRAS